MKKVVGLMLRCAIAMCLTSCSGCSSTKNPREDDQYWESINREQALRDAGLDGAANMEQKARRDYLQGGGYTSPNGGKQVHYQGSKEQARDLEIMESYGW